MGHLRCCVIEVQDSKRGRNASMLVKVTHLQFATALRGWTQNEFKKASRLLLFIECSVPRMFSYLLTHVSEDGLFM